MKIGQRLRELRENMDLMQKAVANRVGISNKVLSNYENDKLLPDLETFKQLCSFYNISADELLGIKKSNNADITELLEDEKKVLYYYNRLDDDYKDSAKGHLVDLYREQQNTLPDKPRKNII